jgi:hypothetical protein
LEFAGQDTAEHEPEASVHALVISNSLACKWLLPPTCDPTFMMAQYLEKAVVEMFVTKSPLLSPENV